MYNTKVIIIWFINMRMQNISIALFAIGVTILGVHQYAKGVIFSKITDGTLRLNLLDDFSDVFALSLLIILGSLILFFVNAAYTTYRKTNEKV